MEATDDSASRDALFEVEFALEVERDERGQTERELAHARAHLARLEDWLRADGLHAKYWELHDSPGTDEEEPEEVQTVTDAAIAAQLHLSDSVSVPDSALRELEGIDTGPNAFAWGNTAWRGLRALAAYTRWKEDGGAGDFHQWCNQGHPLSWPATIKKLAMRESESVANNPSFRRSRTFPVSRDLAPDGVLYMEAHLKISEGGGNLAPRIYFYDDTMGTTGRVHVGFIGPHYLVPNTLS